MTILKWMLQKQEVGRI